MQKPSLLPRNTSQLFNCNTTDSRNVTWIAGTFESQFYAFFRHFGPIRANLHPFPHYRGVANWVSQGCLRLLTISNPR